MTALAVAAPTMTMHAPFTTPRLPVLVFTDLDGTLLDHDDYSFSAALPALERLKQLAVPLIPTTSKTLAEVAELNQQRLDNPHPCILENGSALCLPPGYFGANVQAPVDTELGYQVLRLVPDYAEVLASLHRIRSTQGLNFRGFHDMTVDEVARDTGLAPVDAARARQRLCSEPLIWRDSDDALALFRRHLDDAGLTLTRGGRYWHVMGRTDKAQAMARLCALYRQAGFDHFTTIALGDSPNDAAMLAAADIAVIVRRKDGSWLEGRGREQTINTEATGPAGWNAAMLQLLDRLSQQHPTVGN